MSKVTRVKKEDYDRLRRYSKKHNVDFAEALSQAVKKLEVRKTESAVKTVREVKFDTCDECGREIPEDSEFCPYCGVEFDDSEEDDEEEEEEED